MQKASAVTTAAITARTLTVTATGIDKPYDGTSTATITLNDNRISGDALTTAYTSATFADKKVGSGKVVSVSGISISGTDAGNYAQNALASTTAAITARALTVTATGIDKQYDGTPTATVTLADNRVSGDTVTIAYNSAAFADKGVGIGKAVSVAGLSIGGTDAGNYTLKSTTASTTANITAISLTVTANSRSKSYGQVIAFGGAEFTANGQLAGDSVTSVTLSSLGAAATATVNGGPYTIAPSAAVGTGLGNYTIAYVNGSLTVNKAVLTVTAAASTKVYGAADPALTYAATNFANGETSDILTGSLSRAAGENVGLYAVTAGTLSAGANYAIAFNGANLSISKAPLTITAENKSKLHGEPNPTLTARFDGLASFDTVASLGGVPLLSTVANAGSSQGSYAIVASIGSISSTNYSYSFVDGTLTVIGATPQTISFGLLRPKTFGDGDFDPGASASSGLPVAYASSTPGIAAIVAGKVRVLAPGVSDITASQAGNLDYEPAADVVRNLKVNPPPWNGLGFDGIDDLMRIDDAPQLNFGSKAGFTVETWLHLDGSQPDGTGLLSKGSGGSPGNGYQLILHQDRIAAEIGDGAVGFGVRDGLIGTSSLNDGQWHHVALAVDRVLATAALYLDGRLEVQLSDQALRLNADNSEMLRVGVDRSGALFFKGEMDELRIWDTARSRDEIRGAVSRIIEPLEEPHLMAYFHFDEGDAGLDNAAFASAPERTANTANGALQGFALSGSGSNWVTSGAFLPLLETVPITSITADAAVGGGSVYPNYYPATEVGLCWGTSPNPGLADTCSRSGSGEGTFGAAISGLTPGVAYHVRAYASNQMGTAYGNDVGFRAAKLEQTISFSIPDKTYGDPGFCPQASASSGLAVTYASSNPAVAAIVDGKISITGAGSATITASQGGNESYEAAIDVARTFTVHRKALAVTADNQARAYQMPNPTLTASYQGFANDEDAAAISGAPVLSTAAVQASPIGNYPIVVGLGTLYSPNYSFVPTNGTLNVFRSCQDIIFPAIGDRTFGDPPIELVATSCSGLGISFSSSNTQIAQVSGDMLSITGAGSVVITASQGGSDNLDKAPDVSQTVVIHKAGQAIVFASLAQKTLGDTPFGLKATATSGLPVSYLSTDTSVAVINGNTVTIVGAGTTVITALQAGDANFNAALPASVPFTVSAEGSPPLLALSTLASGAVTANPVLNVMGTASDPSGIENLSVNGIDLTGRAALFSSAVALSVGDNSIEVTAKDGAGNVTTQTLMITFDAAAPLLALSAPADNSVVSAAYFSADGTVTPGSAVTMGINGGSAQSLTVADGVFTGGGYLQQGMNTIEFTATLSGRTSSIKRSVTVAPGKPFVAITDPPEDLRTEKESITIRGTVGAQSGEAGLVIEVDRRLFTPTLQSGVFEQQIALDHTGQIRITASATDGANNLSVAQRNIIRIDRILGDVNGDGCVDIRDALALLRISMGLDPVTAEVLAHGDVAPLISGVPQPDGKINLGDVVVLLRKVVGLANF